MRERREEERGKGEDGRKVDSSRYGWDKRKHSCSFRSTARSCTGAVTRMPPPSLTTLHLKSRSSSSGNMQWDFLWPLSPVSAKQHVGVDQREVSDRCRRLCSCCRNKAAVSQKAQGSRTECEDTVDSHTESAEHGGLSRDIHHIILPQVQ